MLCNLTKAIKLVSCTFILHCLLVGRHLEVCNQIADSYFAPIDITSRHDFLEGIHHLVDV